MSGWKKYLAAAMAAGIALLSAGCGQKEETVFTTSGGQAVADAEARSQGILGKDSSGTECSGGTAAAGEAGSGKGLLGVSAEGQIPAAQESGLESLGTEAETAPVWYVYVCGAVRSPGVYGLAEGSRVYEAVAMAGGFTDEADEEWLNQAEPVADGQKLQVYTRQETQEWRAQGLTSQTVDGGDWPGGQAAGGSPQPGTRPADGAALTGSSAEGAAGDGKVNLNTASKEELMTLSGIGEAKAEAILSYRQEHGVFSSIEEIQKIPGIKSAVFSQIKDWITV